MTLGPANQLCEQSMAETLDEKDNTNIESGQVEIALHESADSPSEVQRNTVRTYGSFLIDGSEFAIPVTAVQEVVSEPTDISPMQLSPPYMLGLFNLRGMIIPIVDLRTLLEFPEKGDAHSRKVAVIEHGEHCIGLLFDRTGEVLSEQAVARVDFRSSSDRSENSVVEGVLKFDNGERLVQILDPYELLRLDKLPCANNISESQIVKSAKGRRRNCIAFETGHTCFAIDLRFVKEVKEMSEVDRTLLAGGCVIGTTNLRGDILPVIDFRSFLGDDAVLQPEKTSSVERKILVLETSEGPVALLVFSIASILPYHESDVLKFAKLALPRSDFFKGCLIDEDNKIVVVLDQDKLKHEPIFVAAARSCREIYKQESVDSGVDKKNVDTARQTYIRFTCERRFVVETTHVCEVIDHPEEMLEPPFSMDFIEGIINLRSELITLFNVRKLYGLPLEANEGQKILIFKHEGGKYGLLVDSVDEIIMTTKGKMMEFGHLSIHDSSRNVAEDISGCLQHTLPDGGLDSIMVLNTDALLERCLKSAE